LFKNRDVLDFSAWSEIAIGFALAFVSGVIVVKWVLGYVSQHGYALFGWWRIIVGTIALVMISGGL
jgi:undecaprenyl-diphosphatase